MSVTYVDEGIEVADGGNCRLSCYVCHSIVVQFTIATSSTFLQIFVLSEPNSQLMDRIYTLADGYDTMYRQEKCDLYHSS